VQVQSNKRSSGSLANGNGVRSVKSKVSGAKAKRTVVERATSRVHTSKSDAMKTVRH